MRHDADQRQCQIFAVTAWIVTFAWFCVATVLSWGFVPGGMLMWSIAALPLTRVTLRWLETRNLRPSPSLTIRVRRWWWSLALAQLVFVALTAVPIWDSRAGEQLMEVLWHAMNVLYAVFPLALTGWMIIRSVQRRPI